MGDENMRCLIVDDEPDMCWVLEHILKNKNVLSAKATTAVEALLLLETNSFQIAFIDAKLPDIEGFELAKLIREKEPSMRLVMISGFYTKDSKEVKQALHNGLISGFISKPFNNKEVQAIFASS
jgi:DNA-binding NtrC family response regulator